MDKRKKYYLVVDVETANSTEQALVYDLGFSVCDKQGRVYEQRSYIISDVFFDEKISLAIQNLWTVPIMQRSCHSIILA